MIGLNNQKSNNLKVPLGELASNTRLIIPNTTPTTTNKTPEFIDNNSFQSLDFEKEFSTVFHNHSDWLTVNFEGLTENQFQELLKLTGRELITLEKDQAFSQGEKAKSYQNTINSPIGLKGAYNSYKIENRLDTLFDVTISLSGQYFSSLTTIEQGLLYRDLYYRYQAKCSRTDVSIDDYSFDKIPFNQMIEGYRSGNCFDFRGYHHETDEKNPDNPTTVHYFGCRGSKKLVRIYNHKNQSLRLETQFRGKYAQAAFEAIATKERDNETDEEWTKIIQKTFGGIAVGAIDFRDRSKLNNPKKASKSKTKRFTWWQDFIDQVGAVHLIKTKTRKPDMTMYQSKFNWLEKVASKTLAIIFHILGNDRFIRYVFRLVKHGESKLTLTDRKAIEHLKNNLELLNFD